MSTASPSEHGLSRRAVLVALSGAALAACSDGSSTTPSDTVGPSSGASTTAPAPEPIEQPATRDAAGFLAAAEEQRRRAVAAGDQSFGAVVVLDGRIVGIGPSRVVTDTDPTAHAEMVALRDTARRLGRRDLGGAILYSTSPPCPMCEAAAVWSGIAGMVHASSPATTTTPALRRC